MIEDRVIKRVSADELNQRAHLLGELYRAKGLSIVRGSSLGELISSVSTVQEKSSGGTATASDWADFFLSMHFLRISDSLLFLADVPGIDRYLVILGSGSLDLLARAQSQAKDIYWELELLVLLMEKGLVVRLEDPPDIVWEWDGLRIGIACKKLYSEKNVSKVLSQAVRQVERHTDFGIAAFNLDDLLPENKIFRSVDRDGALGLVEKTNMQFLEKHHHRFLSYFANARLLSVLASCNVVADVPSSRPRFLNVNDRVLLNTKIDVLRPDQTAALQELRRHLEKRQTNVT